MHLISKLKKNQGIPLFQAVAASKDNTLLQNLTNDDQITPNKRLYLFLFPKTFPIVYFVVFLYLWMTSYLWIRLEWLTNILSLNNKLRMENNKLF